ncbi:hypothetical protein PGT21_023679 [Puccinia graminis f. sp. tritici]|uniref:Uncharacterized protein n=1 Tax=Puccinia graminis f. sp. tritici TaxID=56615 RepID=A0A5B0QUY5_PUCGR|nr:hypothetical protein PGT21_023679 [Puccinia graminis f. sp. tritici]
MDLRNDPGHIAGGSQTRDYNTHTKNATQQENNRTNRRPLNKKTTERTEDHSTRKQPNEPA